MQFAGNAIANAHVGVAMSTVFSGGFAVAAGQTPDAGGGGGELKHARDSSERCR
jgi:hypothetical protein